MRRRILTIYHKSYGREGTKDIRLLLFFIFAIFTNSFMKTIIYIKGGIIMSAVLWLAFITIILPNIVGGISCLLFNIDMFTEEKSE